MCVWEKWGKVAYCLGWVTVKGGALLRKGFAK